MHDASFDQTWVVATTIKIINTIEIIVSIVCMIFIVVATSVHFLNAFSTTFEVIISIVVFISIRSTVKVAYGNLTSFLSFQNRTPQFLILPIFKSKVYKL